VVQVTTTHKTWKSQISQNVPVFQTSSNGVLCEVTLYSGINLSYVCENKLWSISFSIPSHVRASPSCFRLVTGNERCFRTQDFRCLHTCCVHVIERENPLLVVGYWKLDIITVPSIGRRCDVNECMHVLPGFHLNLGWHVTEVWVLEPCHGARYWNSDGHTSCNEVAVLFQNVK